jgi:bifunctional enzyme CysN/CysC
MCLYQTPADNVRVVDRLSGAGKSTLANPVEKQIPSEGKHICTLDSDIVRHGLSRDLGFRDAGRIENIRSAAEVPRLMVAGVLIVLVSFIMA